MSCLQRCRPVRNERRRRLVAPSFRVLTRARWISQANALMDGPLTDPIIVLLHPNMPGRVLDAKTSGELLQQQKFIGRAFVMQSGHAVGSVVM